MYILINKNSNKVMYTSEKKFSEYSDNLLLCEVESLPQSYDYLIAENIREKTDTWQEVVQDYDDNGELVSTTEEMSRTYFTCDLVAEFRPQPTSVQIEKAKQKQYDNLCEKYIRQEYSVGDEFKILRKKDLEPEKYNEYFNYIEYCLAKAKAEIYGN